MLTNFEKANFILSSLKLNVNKDFILHTIGFTEENINLIKSIEYKLQRMNNEKIFVSVAAYRDINAVSTIENLFLRAEHPENLNVFCLYQGEESDEAWELLKFLEERFTNNLSIGFVHYSKAEGTGWARSNIFKNITDEHFFFQIDSHMLFTGHWDTKLKRDYLICPSQKTLISGHPAPYAVYSTKYDKAVMLDYIIGKMVTTTADRFGLSNIYASDSLKFDTWSEIAFGEPMHCGYVSAGYLFGPTDVLREVPYDPYIYFNGEEIDLSIRTFTYGWDLYAPADCYIWHLYHVDAEDKELSWQDFPEKANARQLIAKERLWHRYGIPTETSEISLKDTEKYGVGNIRSIEEWEIFVGLDLKNMTLR